MAAVIPYVRTGLERNQQCLYIVDENTAEVVLQAMTRGGIDTDDAIRSGALRVATSRDTYLRDGRFDADRMLEYLEEAVEAAKAAGFAALRVTGEMTWVLNGDEGADGLIEYEAKLNRFLPTRDALAICQYNRKRFRPEILRDVIHTHPELISGDMVCHNFYYVPPEEMLAGNAVANEVDRLLSNVRERAVNQDILARNESLLRSMVNTITETAFLMDTRGIVLACNETCAARLGKRVDDLLGKNAFDFLPPDVAHRRREYVARVVASRAPVRFEDERQGRIIDQCIYPVQDRDNTVSALAVFGLDVTDRRLAERSLQETREQYRRIVETANDGVWAMDDRQMTTFVNDQMARSLGYTVEEMVGRPVTDFMFSDDLPDHRIRMQARRTGADDRYERRFRHKDGGERWMLVSSAALMGQEGQFAGSFGMFTDITERKRAEMELKQHMRLLDRIRQAQSLFISQHEPEAVFRSLLESLVAMTGSEYGFLDEVFRQEDGQLYKRNLAITDISWDAESLKLYEQLRSADFEFRNLNNLSGAPAQSGRLVIANDPGHDPRSGGLPHGHPPVSAFMGLPMYFGGELVGVAGVANRPGGYTEDLAGFLEPFTTTCASIIQAIRNRRNEQAHLQALRESENRLRENATRQRALLDNIADPAWLKDASGRFLDVNEAWCRFTGRRRDEVVGKLGQDVFPAERAADLAKEDETVIRTGQSSHLEESLCDSQGRTRWFDTIKRPIVDGSGRIVGTTGLARDITQRKEAEAALRASEEQFRAIFQLAAVGIAQADPQTGRWLRVNGKMCEITGYSAEELLDLRVPDITHPEDRERDWEMFQRVVRGEQNSYHLEKRYLRKNGEVAWVNVNMTVIRDGEGRPAHTIAAVENITQRKQAELQLRDREQRFRSYFELPLIGACITSPEKGWVQVNDRAYRLLGYPEAELREMTWAQITHPEDLAADVSQFERMLRGEIDRYQMEKRFIRKDGQIVHVDMAVGCVRKPDRSVDYVVALLQDITERKQREQEKAALEAQLQQSQKLEAVGQLASGVAHEFNNLLTVIRGYAELAQLEVPPDHAVCPSLANILDAATQASGVTHSLLTFSRKLEGRMEQITPVSVVEEAVRLLQRLLPRSIEIAVDAPPEPKIWILADRVQLKQVILNLAINARDAMPQGGRLRITCRTGPDHAPLADRGARPVAYIEVSDSGTGMAPELLKRIFDPFFTTKPRGQGTGLGLSIVHGIIKSFGGRIEVQSAVGKGSHFAIVLPCHEGPPETASPSESRTLPPAEGEMVLLADDNPQILEMLTNALKSQGYAVVQAADGEEMLQVWAQEQERIRLMVVDNDMPRRTGLDSVLQIRRAGSRTPVILITGAIELSHRDLRDPCTMLLSKPFRVAELIEQARRMLQASGREIPQLGAT